MMPMRLSVLLVSGLVLILSGSTSSAGGSASSGGGDDNGLEVKTAMIQALNQLETSGVTTFGGTSMAEVRDLVKKVSALILEDDQKDRLVIPVGDFRQQSACINDPDTFYVYCLRGRWNAITAPFLREAIALHELLSLMRLESTGHYPYSEQYLIHALERFQSIQPNQPASQIASKFVNDEGKYFRATPVSGGTAYDAEAETLPLARLSAMVDSSAGYPTCVITLGGELTSFRYMPDPSYDRSLQAQVVEEQCRRLNSQIASLIRARESEGVIVSRSLPRMCAMYNIYSKATVERLKRDRSH